MSSDMDGQVVASADHNKLVGAFEQVKATSFNLCNHRGASNFPFNIAHGAPDDATFLRGLCAEKLMKEGGVPIGKVGWAQLNLSHLSKLGRSWFTKYYRSPG